MGPLLWIRYPPNRTPIHDSRSPRKNPKRILILQALESIPQRRLFQLPPKHLTRKTKSSLRKTQKIRKYSNFRK